MDITITINTTPGDFEHHTDNIKKVFEFIMERLEEDKHFYNFSISNGSDIIGVFKLTPHEPLAPVYLPPSPPDNGQETFPYDPKIDGGVFDE